MKKANKGSILIYVAWIFMFIAWGIGMVIVHNQKKTINVLREELSDNGLPSYEEAIAEYNEKVASGVYLPRINDEIIVYKVISPTINFVDKIRVGERWELISWDEANNIAIGEWRKEPGRVSYDWESNREYSQVILLNTAEGTILKTWIKSDLIKPVHSNWGLTQDVWKLDERISKIEKKESGISDNSVKVNWRIK